MKVSVEWMKQFGGAGLNVVSDKLVEKIGSQLGEVEDVVNLGERYDGIVVAKVVSCIKHPDADKLSVCLIDDNKTTKGVKRDSKGLVQVVCGAPNVQAGQLVAWLPPGVTVPATLDKDPLVLEARNIRGETSNGMLASANELDLSDNHDGILVIDPIEVGKDLAKPGTTFKRLYGLDDHIIDIENKMFTHRPDCFGQLGVAREVSGINHKTFRSPSWYVKENSFDSFKSDQIKSLTITNEIPKLCRRYMAIAIDDVEVKPSPIWLQTYLNRIGVRPINNIVDITNYIMLMTGQPLHAFDFDKVAQNGRAKIVVRNPKKGETIKLLGGKTIEPRADAILICDQDKPIALGGVMGGDNSEIDNQTKRIIIECANFDMYNIRRTSMAHGLFTDAVTRFTKNQSPEQCAPVLYKTVQMISELCNDAKPIGHPVESYPRHAFNTPVAVSASFINDRLGTKLTLKEIAKLLENVEFKIKTVPADKSRLHIQAPFWRTDIEIPEDIVEEVGRLYGYDHLPLILPTRSIQPARPQDMLSFKNSLRSLLAEAGANELLTYTFVHSDLLEKSGQNPEDAFKLSNALSPDLQYYRLSLLPSLLEKVQPNLRSDRVRGEDNEFAIFEINPVHSKTFLGKDGLPAEDQRLALVFAADDKTATRKYQGVAYYAVVSYANYLLNYLGINTVFEPASQHQPKAAISQAAIAPFDKARTAIVKTVDGDFIGEIGEFSTKIRQNLKLPLFSAGFEFDVNTLLKLTSANQSYMPMPRFPKVVQDITLKVPVSTTYAELYNYLTGQLVELLPNNIWSELGLPRIYQSDTDTKHKNVTWRLWLSNYDKTLTTAEVNNYIDALTNKLIAIDAERV
ncbi:MAG TPA: phenylalanine--tRNA ligase subunit beta [Candidatus Saccharimonadales bacterium]|nr:phenylalanine--tRNA ligase subunit beta [Candidatus Saccharimonadales bacterium]